MFQFGTKVKFSVNMSFHDDWAELSSEVAKTERIAEKYMRKTNTVDALNTILKFFEDAPPRQSKE